MAGRLSLWLYILVLIWIGLGVLCLYIPPDFFWPAGFVAYSLPAPLLLNLLFLLYWAVKLSPRAFIPLGLALALSGLYSRSYKIGFGGDDEAEGENTFSVMSFNVRAFRIDPEIRGRKKRRAEVQNFLNYVKDYPADIICLQEYYNSEKHLKTTAQIKKKLPHYFVSLGHRDKGGDQYGIAVFSKYPVIHKGTIAFDRIKANHAMFADIVLPQADTIRVYSFHLESMKIKSEHIPELSDGNDELRNKGTTLFRRLRYGFIERGEQVKELRDHIEKSPYPVIITGDLNDLPHSYTYQTLRRFLKNSFEEAGSGIGASFADVLPMLRIDNHFVSPAINVHNFVTIDTVTYSDHYPTKAVYSLDK